MAPIGPQFTTLWTTRPEDIIKIGNFAEQLLSLPIWPTVSSCGEGLGGKLPTVRPVVRSEVYVPEDVLQKARKRVEDESLGSCCRSGKLLALCSQSFFRQPFAPSETRRWLLRLVFWQPFPNKAKATKSHLEEQPISQCATYHQLSVVGRPHWGTSSIGRSMSVRTAFAEWSECHQLDAWNPLRCCIEVPQAMVSMNHFTVPSMMWR